MALSTKTAGDPVPADDWNQVVTKVNESPSRVVITSSGNFTAQSHRIRVTLCGGGGGGNTFPINPESDGTTNGGDSPMVSRHLSVEPGASYGVTIGAAGATGATGGTTSFSSLLSSTGGTGGGTSESSHGSTGSQANAEIRHANDIFMSTSGVIYGKGGSGSGNGTGGICIIEW